MILNNNNNLLNIVRETEKENLSVSSFGFEELDNTWNKIQTNDFIYVVGQPGSGKTKMLMNLAFNIAKETTVFYVNLKNEELEYSESIVQSFVDFRNSTKTEENQLRNMSVYTFSDFEEREDYLMWELERKVKEESPKVLIVDGLLEVVFAEYCETISFNQDEMKFLVLKVLKRLYNIGKNNKVAIVLSEDKYDDFALKSARNYFSLLLDLEEKLTTKLMVLYRTKEEDVIEVSILDKESKYVSVFSLVEEAKTDVLLNNRVFSVRELMTAGLNHLTKGIVTSEEEINEILAMKESPF